MSERDVEAEASNRITGLSGFISSSIGQAPSGAVASVASTMHELNAVVRSAPAIEKKLPWRPGDKLTIEGSVVSIMGQMVEFELPHSGRCTMNVADVCSFSRTAWRADDQAVVGGRRASVIHVHREQAWIAFDGGDTSVVGIDRLEPR